MRAETFVQRRAGGGQAVASRTTAFVAIARSTRRTVITGRDHAFVPHNNRGHFPLHAIRSRGYDLRNIHEILVPAWPVYFLQKLDQELIDLRIQLLERTI